MSAIVIARHCDDCVHVDEAAVVPITSELDSSE
jgi:hypothetical protein